MARALVGSEGTCVTVLEATLRLTASPPFRRLVCIGFPDPFIAADHVPDILTYKPIGLEGFDNAIPDSLRAKGMRLDELKVLPEGKGVLLVEFGAWTSEDADAQAERFGAWLGDAEPAARSTSVCTPHEAAAVWHVRESALGAVAIQPGKRPGWEGWEDAAVPPDRLGSYLRAIFALMREYDYDSPLYGHFGEGCVHMRIDFDLETEPGIQKFREFIDRAADIVVDHGGSISGEHGDGQSRGALLPKMFGPELMEAFREFKRLWDPDNKMNPGKLIDARQPHADLRLGADYRPQRRSRRISVFRTIAARSPTRRCAASASAPAARKRAAPCARATWRRAKRNTRPAAARICLWELLQGEVLEDGWQNEDVKDALDLCLSCKACKTECPTNVDLATYKAEFLAHYYEGRSRPLHAYAFGMIDRWARMASYTPGLANAFGRFPLTARHRQAPAAHRAERKLPEFATIDASGPEPHLQRTKPRRSSGGLDGAKAGMCLLWADTFTNYFQPHIAEAAYDVLTAPDSRSRCCGGTCAAGGRSTTSACSTRRSSI